ADDAGAKAAVKIRLGTRRELRAFNAEVGPAVVNHRAARARRGRQVARQIRAYGIGQRNMHHQPVAEERLGTLECTIDKLIRNHQFARMNFLFQAARGRYRNEVGHAELLHAENSGAEIYFRRQQSMAAAVTREKSDLDVPDAALVERIRRPAERSLELHQLALVQPLPPVEAAASDHSK